MYNDTYFAAAQVVTYCLKNELDLVLTGDQFDTPRPPSGALAFFQECASVLHDAGLNCYALPGNHDSCNPEWTDVVPHVTNIKDKRVIIGSSADSLTLQGVGHGSFSDLKMKLEQLDVTGVDVLVMHQLLDLACPLESMHNLKAEWLPQVPAVVMGDLHDPTSLVTPSCVHVVCSGPQSSWPCQKWFEIRVPV